MTDYNSYRESKDLRNNDIIRAVRSGYPMFSKMQMSLVNNPGKNGVCLLPEAEQLLVNAYGAGPGLSISQRTPVKKKNHDNKNKPRRLSVRLSEPVFEKVNSLVEKMAFATMQDFLEAAVQQMIERYSV